MGEAAKDLTTIGHAAAATSDAALADLLDRGFDFLCSRPLADFVDTALVLAAVDRAFTPPRITTFFARFIAPGRERLLARARESKLLLGAWLPDATRDALAALLGAPVTIPQDLIDELVTSDRVRDSVREMLQESLSSMMAKTPLGWGARAASGLFGARFNDEVGDRMGQFLDLGVGIVQQRIAQRLAARDTAKALGKRRRRAFKALLLRRETEAGTWFARIPHAMIDALAPTVIAHNLARPEVRDGLRAEIDAVLTELSQQPVGALLDEYGVRALCREAFRARGLPLARAFLAAP